MPVLHHLWLHDVHVQASLSDLAGEHLGGRCLHWAIAKLLRDCHAGPLLLVDTACCLIVLRPDDLVGSDLLWIVHIHEAVVGHIRIRLLIGLRQYVLLLIGVVLHCLLYDGLGCEDWAI